MLLCFVVFCGVVLEAFLDHFGYRFDDIFDVLFVSIFGHVFDVLRVGSEPGTGEGGVDPAYRGIPALDYPSRPKVLLVFV